MKRKLVLWVLLGAIGTGLVLYPLSFGPASVMMRAGYMPDSILIFLYDPLVWVSDHSPKTISDVLLWSYRCCEGRDP